MEKIESMSLRELRNNEHFQFMTDVDTLITTCQSGELGIDALYPSFKEMLNAEDAAMRIEQGSSKSKTLEEVDKERDDTWFAISTKIKANLKSPVVVEMKSAEALKRIIDLYGDVRTLTYNEESAAVTNLVSDLLKPENASHLSNTGISVWVPELKSRNEQFQVLFNERNSELANRESGNVRAARKQSDSIYEQIVERINASIVMGLAKPVTDGFVKELNEKIGYYKTTLAIRAGNNKKDAVVTE